MAEFCTDVMVFFGCYETIRHYWVAYEENVYGFAQTSDIHTVFAIILTFMITSIFHNWRKEERVRKEVQK